jgi:hypothetical protein
MKSNPPLGGRGQTEKAPGEIQVLFLLPSKEKLSPKVKVIFYSLLFLTSTFIQAQKVDYLKVRDDLVTLTCGGSKDSADVFGSIRRLEAFDTMTIRKNIHVYYEDLAVNYWLASGGRDNVYLRKSIWAYHASLYHIPNNTKSLWNLAFAYGSMKDCEKAKYYFDQYDQYLPQRYRNEENDAQKELVLANCN